mgnify:CR=1 FL=1
MIDWGEGTYEHTAETLVDAAEVGIDHSGSLPASASSTWGAAAATQRLLPLVAAPR